MSSRDIEGENPLYLPQAKVYDGVCGLGPGISSPTAAAAARRRRSALRIGAGRQDGLRGHDDAGGDEAVARRAGRWLFRDNQFPRGALLLTGTGIVPPDDFTLASGDEVTITIEPIGTLVNRVL